MSIQQTFACICEDVRLEISGRISIIGVFDILALPAFPGGGNLCVTTRWTSTGAAQANVSLYMQTPDNPAPIRLVEQRIELQDKDRSGFCSAGTVAKFAWQFHTPGVYNIQIRLEDEEKDLLPLMVRKRLPSENKGQH